MISHIKEVISNHSCLTSYHDRIAHVQSELIGLKPQLNGGSWVKCSYWYRHSPQNVRMAPLYVAWIACFRNNQYGAYKTSHVMLIRNAVTRISAPLQPLTVLPTEFFCRCEITIPSVKILPTTSATEYVRR